MQDPRLLQVANLKRRVSTGASWFYWIAAISLINLIIGLGGGGISFVIGLGSTQIIDGFFSAIAGDKNGLYIALIPDLFLIAMFAGFGYLANKRNNWAFMAGMGFYALDTVIFIGISLTLGISGLGTVLAIAFHLYALYRIYIGWRSNIDLTQLLAMLQLQTGSENPTVIMKA